MFDTRNHYETLEVPIGATPQEIRSSYLRLRIAYSRDSVALHGLVGSEDATSVLHEVERAYQVLSDPDRRREYDQSFGGTELRAPDMNPDLQLIAPAMPHEEASVGRNHDSFDGWPSAPSIPNMEAAIIEIRPTAAINPITAPVVRANPDLDAEIAAEREWTGAFLKRVREGRGLTIAELSSRSRISKTYLLAIEEEAAKKLPAPVFTRGFVIQLARELKLPSEQVASAYLARLNAQLNQKPA